MTPNVKLCLGCMNPLAEGEGKCPHCGYQDGMPYSFAYLKPGTVLKDRYLMGRVIKKNSEGATYIGYDLTEDKKVLIREFMPVQIAERNEATMQVRPIAGSERQYKTALSDFVELSRQLLAQNHISDMVPVMDRFVDNDTVYVVYRYVQTLTLSSFLQRNGGELTWNQTKKLFLPLLNSLAKLHKKGIIHRGISPETILVDQDSRLWLSGFCITDCRTEGSDLGAELFPGYSAPEQYSLNSWQGAWSDVYSIAAVLYRAMTGARPEDGNSRRVSDDLCTPAELNSKIPENVSEAIFAAMAVEGDQRPQSIDEFTGMLLEEGDTHTAVFESSKVALEAKKTKSKKVKKSHAVLWITLLTFLLLLGGMFWFMDQLGIFEEKPVQSQPDNTLSYLDNENSQAEGPVSADGVPDFTGKDIDAIKNDPTYTNRFMFLEKEDYNENFSKNVVYGQEPVAGTPMPNKGYVTLYVSKGSEMVPVPGLSGSTLEFATRALTELELKYEVIYIVDSSAEAGQIIRTYPSEGEVVSRKTSTVYIYIKDETASNRPGGWVGIVDEDTEEEE